MYKTCPNCNHSFYSATAFAVTVCPHCGQDLTFDNPVGHSPLREKEDYLYKYHNAISSIPPKPRLR